MTTQYSPIAALYRDHIESRPERPYALDPTVHKHLGPLESLDVLDLACGDGYFTRRLKRWGARRVVGMDIELEQMRLAMERERQENLGVEYVQGDVARIGSLSPQGFDIVLASFLLHYASSVQELEAMCQGIARNLEEGGRFLALNSDPRQPLVPKKEGHTSAVEAVGELSEGGKLRLTLYDPEGPKAPCSFELFYWKQETYERALAHAGFSDLRWHPIEISDEGMRKYGSDFWARNLNPSMVLIEARLAPGRAR
jgi:SAM-dependent methyltransferase